MATTDPQNFEPLVQDPVPQAGPKSTVKIRYIIVPEDDIKPYIIHGSGANNDKNFYCESRYNLLGLSAVEISNSYLETIRPQLGRSFEEISEHEFYFGTAHFGEIRDTVKIAKTETGVIWDYTPALPEDVFKAPIEFSGEMKGYTLAFMKKFAKELIENEYSKKLKFIKNVSELEAATWEIQKHEAREWLTNAGLNGSVTPFLDYLATERGEDKTVLSNKILQKAEAYQDKLSTMLVSMQKLKKQFKNSTSIKDINILYEDYLGVMMPTTQAIELGRTLSTTDWARKPEYEVMANEFNF